MAELNNQPHASGLVISEEVISRIACVAAKEVPGVKDVISKPSDIKNILAKDRFSRAVRIQNGNNTLIIDIYVVVKAGVRITAAAEQVQKQVKEAVQNMTGYLVTKVNVNIEDIDLSEDTGSKKS